MENIDTFGIKNVCFSLSGECSVDNEERQSLWKKQRMERGFDDTELWNLDSTILSFTLPRLKEFREQTISYPTEFNTLEEWQKVLDKMIDGIEKKVLEDSVINCDNEGFDLFIKYFHCLWW